MKPKNPDSRPSGSDVPWRRMGGDKRTQGTYKRQYQREPTTREQGLQRGGGMGKRITKTSFTEYHHNDIYQSMHGFGGKKEKKGHTKYS